MAIINYVVYSQTTGAILRWGVTADTRLHLQAREGEVAIETDDAVGGDQLYFDLATQEFVPLRKLDLAVNGCTISGIPPGSVVQTESSAFPVEDGTIELTYDFDGTYNVVVLAPTYERETLQVTQGPHA